MLTMYGVAARAGLSYRSVRQYRWRGILPEPDGMLGTTPWWKEETIDRWVKARKGVDKVSTDAVE